MKRYISIIGYIFGLAFNVPHIVATYQMIDTITGLPFIYIVLMVCVIDFTILVLAINEDKEKRLGAVPAVTFAWIVFFINLYLYWIDPIQSGMFLDLWNLKNIATLFIKLLFAALPAYIIYYYSEMIADVFKEYMKSDSEKLVKVSAELENVSLTLETVRDELEKYKSVLASFAKIKGCKITVEGVKGKTCKCDRLVLAGSNREANRVCECGNLIEW